jgi:hypothetical protein
VGLGALAAAGAGPAVSFGLAARASLRWRALSVGVEGRADLPASADTAAGPVSGALRLVSLVPCAHLSVLFGCGVVSAGVIQSESEANGARESTAFAAAGARVGVGVPVVSWLEVMGHVDVLATLSRTAVLVDGVEAWRTPPLHGVLGLGALVPFH